MTRIGQLALLTLSLVFPHSPATTRTEHAPSLSSVQTSLIAIHLAARRWHVSEGWLDRVAWCESQDNPRAYNQSGASGLFQFLPSTFWGYAHEIGERRSYWNPYAAANVAAYMFRIGQVGQWVCR